MQYDPLKERLDEVADRLKCASRDITRSMDGFIPPTAKWMRERMKRMILLSDGYRMLYNEHLLNAQRSAA